MAMPLNKHVRFKLRYRKGLIILTYPACNRLFVIMQMLKNVALLIAASVKLFKWPPSWILLKNPTSAK